VSEVWLVSIFGLKGLEETFAFTKYSVYVLVSYDFYLSNYFLILCPNYELVLIIINFVILTAVLWYVTPCSLFKNCRPFKGIFCFHPEEEAVGSSDTLISS